MSERLFRAVRDFVLVRLPLYLRVFAIFLHLRITGSIGGAVFCPGITVTVH